MNDTVCKVSVEQRSDASRIARQVLRKWVGRPVAVAVRRVIRTGERYKVTGMVGPKGQDVRLSTGVGSPFTLIFSMPPGGDRYDVEILVVDKGRIGKRN